MPISSKEELRQLSTKLLLQELLMNTAYGSFVRDVVRERMAHRGVAYVSELVLVEQALDNIQGQQAQPQARPQPELEAQSPPQHGTRIQDHMALWQRCYLGQVQINETARAVLNSGWDFIDPRGLMNKTAMEVQDILEELTYSVGTYTDLGEGKFKNLVRMIFEAYGRAVRVSNARAA